MDGNPENKSLYFEFAKIDLYKSFAFYIICTNLSYILVFTKNLYKICTNYVLDFCKFAKNILQIYIALRAIGLGGK